MRTRSFLPCPFHAYALALALALALLFVTRAAKANMGAPYSRAVGAIPGIVTERRSPVMVEHEELVIDCTGGDRTSPIHPRCTFVATYHLFNPTPQNEEILGAFYAVVRGEDRHRQEDPSAPVIGGPTGELDGSSVPRPEMTDDQLRRMDEIVTQDGELAIAIRDQGLSLQRSPFRIVVAPSARAIFVFRGELAPVRFVDDNPASGYAFPALFVRHIGLVHERRPWEGSEEEFLYLVSPLSGWAGDPEVAITVRYRSALDFAPVSPDTAWTTSSDGDVLVSRTAVRASAKKNLRFRLSYRHFPILNGGPLVGIGPRIGREELRVRLGYEVGIDTFMVLGIAAETNFDEYVNAALTMDFATPNIWVVFPSLALGAGVPVQFREGAEKRIGARGQFTISWPIVSLVFPIDYYPTANSSGSHFEGAFLTQFSF